MAYVILVDESMFGRFRSFKGRRLRRHCRSERFCIATCFTVATYPWFYGRLKQISSRICIIIELISAHALPWFIAPWEEQITLGDVLCSQSERFNSVERTITSFLVGLEVGWEGRVGRQRQEWLALKYTVWVLNFMYLSFTNVKQSKANFRI